MTFFDALIVSAYVVTVAGWLLAIATVFWWWRGADPATDPLASLLPTRGTGRTPDPEVALQT